MSTTPSMMSAAPVGSVSGVEGFMTVPIASLHPHPRNYRSHPADEIEHIKAMIREHAVYRNIVIARDGTILAGHGVVEAASQLDLTEIPVYRKDYAPDDPRAIQILAGDNYISHLAEDDDRALSELLKELQNDDYLLGTGFDEMMLANLVMVTRPASEIADLDAAAHWVGLPEYQDKGEDRLQIIVNFACDEDRIAFCHELGIEVPKKEGTGKSIWWPKPKERVDAATVRFTDVYTQDDAEDDDA